MGNFDVIVLKKLVFVYNFESNEVIQPLTSLWFQT